MILRERRRVREPYLIPSRADGSLYLGAEAYRR